MQGKLRQVFRRRLSHLLRILEIAEEPDCPLDHRSTRFCVDCFSEFLQHPVKNHKDRAAAMRIHRANLNKPTVWNGTLHVEEALLKQDYPFRRRRSSGSVRPRPELRLALHHLDDFYRGPKSDLNIPANYVRNATGPTLRERSPSKVSKSWMYKTVRKVQDQNDPEHRLTKVFALNAAM